MADTPRTAAQLLAAFADGQAAGSILPQDMRDLVVSLEPPHGEVHIVTPIETSVAAANTFYKCLGTTSLSGSEHLVDDGTIGPGAASNRLSYTGDLTDVHMMIAITISFTTATNNQIIAFRIAKDGVTEATSEVQRKSGTGTDQGSVTLLTLVTLDNTNYIELYGANVTGTSTDNFTIQKMTILGLGFFHFG